MIGSDLSVVKLSLPEVPWAMMHLPRTLVVIDHGDRPRPSLPFQSAAPAARC